MSSLIALSGVLSGVFLLFVVVALFIQSPLAMLMALVIFGACLLFIAGSVARAENGRPVDDRPNSLRQRRAPSRY